MSDLTAANLESPDEVEETQPILVIDDGQPTALPDYEIEGIPSFSVTATEEPSVGREIEISSFASAEISSIFSKRPGGGFMRTVTALPRAQFMIKPSLLRRSRGPGTNPLLNPQFVTTLTTQPDTASPPPIPVQSSPIHTVSVSSPEEPEILIWQPDPTDTCEIIEVQESDLASFLQQKAEGDGEIQQIIVCGDGGTEGMDFAEMFQNYMVEVLPEEAEVIHVKKKSKKKPRPAKVPVGGARAAPIGRTGKNITELKCQEPGCDNYSNNVQEMRKHLQDYHEIVMEEEIIHFATEDDFKRWRSVYERDRRVSFIYRGGTKKISPDRAVTYLICHRSGTYKPAMADNSQRMRKMKPQGSCKIGTYCTAGIKLLKQLNTGIVEATICHTHYGHELDNVQHLRISQAMKNILVQKFDEGLSFGQVLQYVHHNPNGLEGFKLIDRRAIRNIYDQWRKPTKNEASVTDVSLNDPTPVEPTTSDGETLKMDGKDPLAVVTVGEVERPSPSISEPITHSRSPSKKNPTKSRGRSAVKIKVEKVDPVIGNGPEALEAVAAGNTEADTSVNVDATMEKLLEHGESGAGPTVLLFKKAGEMEPHTGLATPLLKRDDLCMILQTPIQRQLLQQFGKVVHLELVEGQDMDVLAIVVLDEFLMAIPVAWLVCNQVTENMIKNFFQVILTNCVEINCDYLFASKKSDLHRIWCNLFDKQPRLLYPQEDVLRELKVLLRRHFEETEKRGKCYDVLESLVMTPDKAKFDRCCRDLKALSRNPEFEKAFIQNWYGDRNRWAFHTRTEVHTIMEEAFVKLRKFILFKGTKSLGKNVDSILKIGYDKCFQHNKNLFKGDVKLKSLVAGIDAKHEKYSQYDWSVERVAPNKFKMSLDNMLTPEGGEVFDIFDLKTVCTCKMRCEECGVCIHRFWCTCGDQNLCIHSHALRVYLAIQAEPSEAEIIETKVLSGNGEEDDPFFEFGDLEEQAKPEVVTIIDGDEKEIKPTIQLSARKMKNTTTLRNSSKKPVVRKEPEATSNPVLVLCPEPQSRARRSVRIRKVKPVKEDPLAVTPTVEAIINPPVVPRKRSAASILLEVVPIPFRKPRKSKPEADPLELDVKPVVRGRGRPPRVQSTAAPSSFKSSSSISVLKRTRNSTPAVPLTSLRKKRGEPDDNDTAAVKNELLTLMNQIERIKSARVLKDVKKRISDLTGIVSKQHRRSQ